MSSESEWERLWSERGVQWQLDQLTAIAANRASRHAACGAGRSPLGRFAEWLSVRLPGDHYGLI